MSDNAWEDFKFQHAHIFMGHAEIEVLSISEGYGVWEGQREETHVIITQVEHSDLDNLRTQLAKLGRHWGQDAIGFTAAPASSSLVVCDA